jgi:hypothetical protein
MLWQSCGCCRGAGFDQSEGLFVNNGWVMLLLLLLLMMMTMVIAIMMMMVLSA